MTEFRGQVCFFMSLPTKNSKHTKKFANAISTAICSGKKNPENRKEPNKITHLW